MDSYKKILVINVNWLGDAVFSMPVFRTLKEYSPEASISCLGPSRIRPVMEATPEVDEFIAFDEKAAHKSAWAKWQLITQLRKKKFDAAVILHRSLTRALLAFLAGIPIRVGYNTKNRGMLLTNHVSLPSKELHRADHYLHVLQGIGINGSKSPSTLNVSKSDQEVIEKILIDHRVNLMEQLIVIHSGGNWDLKQWPVHYFQQLVQGLVQKEGIKIILTGSQKDQPRVKDIIGECSAQVVNLTGELDIKQFIALLKRADLLISSDSGPLHLANNVGTNVIGLFGPTRPEITGPIGQGKAIILQHDVQCNQKPCYNLNCPNNICMQSISVEEVFNAIDQIKD
ncbi:MAG: lipopolysaccharide heptosyltransferase II [Candidatus Omnitrophica bacterium]|nr:lipopolysaccharide heptosyltransferase II [Candidatus Omnitrophota bacterium]MCB9746860.1 lipopolysaccharide heptosyltransferase II [Candidatus Omnitrophota bacterium]